MRKKKFQEQPELIENFFKNMLAGDGQNRWADKALNYVIAANGRVNFIKIMNRHLRSARVSINHIILMTNRKENPLHEQDEPLQP